MKDDTRLVHRGRPPRGRSGPVNPPVARASTIIFPTYADLKRGAAKIEYGRLGTSTHRALEDAVTALECAADTKLAPSGLSAAVTAILAFVKAGDHVLMTDAVYDPTRFFCDRFLKNFDVETAYFDPMLGEDALRARIKPNTRVIFAESVGSLTFEVHDIPMLAGLARDSGARLVVDNTWAAGYFFKPLAHGAHVSVEAGTKYFSGHADCLIGSMSSVDDATARAVFAASLRTGLNVSADDAALTLRGMRSLGARMKRHEETALDLARRLRDHPAVARVYHPAFPDHPGHAIWKRDFTGASGLFAIETAAAGEAALAAMLDGLEIWEMGYSWGGFESLVIPVDPGPTRGAAAKRDGAQLFRLHAGLEDADDLFEDFDAALRRLTESG